MASLEDQQALLLYRVGPVLCCSPSYTVLSIIQPVHLTHPPGADAARPGIFRHSGHIIKTEELRVRFGVEKADRKPGRMIITEVDSGRTAFWVDDIIDVVSMPSQGWGKLPSLLPKGIFSRTLLLDDKIYLYADFDALQKLQGHGLLKKYIEQLLQEKDKATPPPVSAKTTTPPIQKPDALKNETHVTPEAPATEKPTAEKIISAMTTKTPAPQKTSLNEETPDSKVSVTTKNSVSTTPKKYSTSAVNENISRPAATQQINTSANKTLEENKLATSGEKSPLEKPTIIRNQQPNTLRKENSDIVRAEKLTTIESPTQQADLNKKSTTETKGGFPWSVFIIILFLLSASTAGIYYYFVNQIKTTVIQYETPETASTYTTKSTTPVIEKTPIIEPPLRIEPTPIIGTTPTTDSVPESSSPEYQAKIEKDDEGITIVIKAPKEEKVLKETLTANTKHQDISKVEMPAVTEKNITSANKLAEEQVLPSNQPQSEVILHIVVKGDTLWHIAKRYVNNPFRYPELARLSNIKNPDLIYPGNRVRIIREFN